MKSISQKYSNTEILNAKIQKLKHEMVKLQKYRYLSSVLDQF